jgi:hypothetical protein
MTISSVRGGKLVRIGTVERFFPALRSGPFGALDAAPEREDDDREAALDAREAACDWREADNEDNDDEDARDRKRGRDARAIARDRRAHDRRGSGGARDGEKTVAELYAHEHGTAVADEGESPLQAAKGVSRGGIYDHRNAADSRLAFDARGRELIDIGALFGAEQRNHE